MTTDIHVLNDETKLIAFCQAAFPNGADLTPSSQGISSWGYRSPFTVMQKIQGFLKGKAACPAGWDSLVTGLELNWRISSPKQPEEHISALCPLRFGCLVFFSSVLEDESVFSW